MPTPSPCGNGELDPGEECEGGGSWFYADTVCRDVGFSGAGRVYCHDCHYDVHACSSERCDNRWDDDGDGLVDCDDPDCRAIGDCPSELCYDGQDNDGDGFVDCEDPDCAQNFPGCNAGLYPSEDAHLGLCGNDRDDDGDGLRDAEDPDCLGYRSVLYLRDPNGGAFVAEDVVDFELVVYADATDLHQIQISSPLPEAVELWGWPQDATYLEESHEVQWLLPLLPWGTAMPLRLQARLLPETEFGTEVCFSATLESATPLEQWHSDDPDDVGPQQPTCITVR